MKYKKYNLTFEGDPEIVAFLEKHMSSQHDTLAQAKALGRAAALLFGVSYKWDSVTLPRSNDA